MSKDVLLLVDVLAKEKNLDKEIVFQSLEKALAIATKKSSADEDPEIEVAIDRTSGKYKTIRKWVVVTDVDFYDDDKELSLSDAMEKYKDVELGDVIEEEIPNIDLGRVSAQTARNIVAQKIKDAEKENMLQEYLSRNRGIVIGKVRKFDRGNVVVDCGKIEAVIMKNDQISKEVLQPGDTVKGYLDKKNLVIRNGRVLISRSNDEFLAKLLENNVPEIASGRIEIKGIARIAGVKSKVSVLSLDSRIDAKGACIGFRNQRIDAVIMELSGEQVEIIDYDADLAQYALNAFAPAEIESIVVYEERKVIDVITEEDKLGSVIGPDGINVRLVSKLLGCTIDILGKDAAKDRNSARKVELIASFNQTLDVDDEISEILVDNGFSSLDEVAYVDSKELLTIEEFDEDVVSELQERAKNKLLSKNLINQEKMDNLAKELNDVAKLSNEVLLKLVEAQVLNLEDFADLATDELMNIINVDKDMADKLIIKAREISGYFA